ncbi:hypothetical protein PHYBLDRAFT_147742 [Phycomyces blakesleeanus NRRL 1555(-)]|uniref:Uncharacterized protein n=1 Tax=Phycomyces blakesleeanus (strain ATCC 8743b / DSM 1359 / FGSC 10004 / NBRC 33097 / NRRL 1555) TaxID=763407 RepID=A0A167LWK4_PHYB8|nr:hypothetical protein PHYBLDRAFT_147742 [Phycomyces blakesleeanus NRRL 1555(-)]OAD71237.1 hypothetical protein PHYBLDRAFT_147742 [Phycomyces blakesleeanus NRRL 1555(-)]|eukprot:XP_018289277.1 hypothetical protein PHYBLDRAFT_147742 [Phycomyces blakesleeanus NRRL 1555(-)]
MNSFVCHPSLLHRLKTRLELAKYKQQHGCESDDLLTLENRFINRHKRLSFERVCKPLTSRRFYCPTSLRAPFKQPRYRRLYGVLPPTQIQCPLSAKRSNLVLSVPEHNAARVLVLLHHKTSFTPRE